MGKFTLPKSSKRNNVSSFKFGVVLKYVPPRSAGWTVFSAACSLT